MNGNHIKVLGNSISYIEKNTDKNKSILFLHGNSLSKECFSAFFQSESYEDYHLVAMDLPGHGESSKNIEPSKNYTIENILKTINVFISELGLKNVTFVGHSLGGHLAIEYDGLYPNQLKGLVTVGTPPLALPPEMDRAFKSNPILNCLFQNEITLEQKTILANEISKSATDKVAQSIEKSDGLFRKSIGGEIMNGNYTDEIKILANTNIPYLLIMGEKDAFCHPEYINNPSFNGTSKRQTRIISNASHSPMMDNFSSFSTVLLEFLSYSK